MWLHLDDNGDGVITVREFLHYVWGMDSDCVDQTSTNRARRFANNVPGWWASAKIKAIRTVLIGFMQLIASLSNLYGNTGASGATGSSATVSAGSFEDSRHDGSNTTIHGGGRDIAEGSRGVVQAAVAMGTAALASASAFISDIDIQVFRFFTCMLGPRFFSSLVVFTIIPVGLCALAACAPRFLKLVFQTVPARCPNMPCSRISKQRRADMMVLVYPKLRAFKNYFVITVIFILYPKAARNILSAFSCRSYNDGSASPPRWLEADATVRCSLEDPQYFIIFAYAICMTGIVIIGMPL